MKSLLYLLFFHLVFPLITFNSYAQIHKSSTLQPALVINDKIPNLVLKVVSGLNKSMARVSDFKSKLLIIDFWATWCGSCISVFPKLEKLKQHFGTDLNFLLVTDENEATINKFNLQRKKIGQAMPNFPVIANDTVLNHLFPHETVPHYIWIDAQGIIKAITDAGEVSIENVNDFITNKPLHLALKDDNAKEVFHDLSKPVFINGNGGNGQAILWHSVLSAEVQGMINNSILSVDQKNGRLEEFNVDVYTLYRTAYGDDPGIPSMRLANNRLFFRVRDSLNYFTKWQGMKKISGKLYCYSLFTPKISETQLKQKMQDDLNLYFNLAVRWEKRFMQCLVLTAEDTMLIRPVSLDSLDTKKRASSMFHYTSLDNPLMYFRHSLTNGFLSHLPYPILDETGYSGWAYFTIECDMSNWLSIDEALSKYKMHLRLQMRNVNVLVVEEKQ